MPAVPEWTLRFLNYEPVDEALDARMQRIASEAALIPAEAMALDREAGVLTVDCSKIPAWKDGRARLRAVRVGRFVIAPPWIAEALAPGEVRLAIDPAGAFGSALHETTQLCLLGLERYPPAGLDVLEVGTGSGVLAVAAARLGAARVHAVDVDPGAVGAARANVTRHGLERTVSVSESVGPPWLERPVDVVVANLTFEVLTRLREGIAAALRPGGLLLASGVSTRFWNDLVIEVGRSGFDPIDQLEDGPWSALIARRRTA